MILLQTPELSQTSQVQDLSQFSFNSNTKVITNDGTNQGNQFEHNRVTFRFNFVGPNGDTSEEIITGERPRKLTPPMVCSSPTEGSQG